MGVDPSRIGTLEPGRQTITLTDRVLGPIELLAFVPVLALILFGTTSLQVLAEPDFHVFSALVLAAFGLNLAVALVGAGWLVRWWWSGPTVLVLRDGALAITVNRVTRTLAYADVASATARKVGPYSELLVVLEAGDPVVVTIGGLHRARAMAQAIEAALERASAAGPEDAVARRALDQLRRAETVRT